MIQVNKKHSVEYKNDYFILKFHGTDKEGNQTTKKTKTYPDIGSMVMYCGFKMDYEYTDAAIKSKSDYEKEWNRQHLNKSLKTK